jgi:hypothetical protein
MKLLHILAIALLPALALTACADRGSSVLTVEGTYSGTTSESCQLALRVAGTQELVDAYELPADFHQDFSVPADKESYRVEVHCPDGKSGSAPAFDFEPPRMKITLNNIELN